MEGPLDELYFKWLYSQVCSVRLKNPARTYWFLLRQLFRKEFVWFIPNDDNRIADGQALRREFLLDMDIPEVDPEWMDLGCSMLEMMIALSRRLAFDTESEASDWFWHLMGNIRLAEFTDTHYPSAPRFEDVVDKILDNIIWRQYTKTGKGGLFPLKRTDDDQTEVEIWYQAAAYLLENQLV